MPHWRRAAPAAIALILVLPGCLHRNCCHSGGSTVASLESVLPTCGRHVLTPDLSGLSGTASTPAEPTYYCLTPPECQCRAVAASSLGNLIDSEQRATARHGKHGRPVSSVQSMVLSSMALEARNQSAAAAMELYYGIAEGEATLDIITKSQAEIDYTLEEVAKIRKQGLEVPFDDTEFQRKKLEVASKRAEVELTLARGNAELRKLLGLSTHDPQARIWPDTDLAVTDMTWDADLEVQQGLTTRPQIGMLRRLSSSLDSESLDTARQVLGRVDGALGLAPRSYGLRLLTCIVPLHGNRAELLSRRRQISQYRAQREQELADEIRAAVVTIEGRTQQVRLARDLAASWEKRVHDLQAERGVGKSSFPQIAQAKLESLSAQADLVKAVVAWKVAIVKLKELEGQLVAECAPFSGQHGTCPMPSKLPIPPLTAEQTPAPKPPEEIPMPPTPPPGDEEDEDVDTKAEKKAAASEPAPLPAAILALPPVDDSPSAVHTSRRVIYGATLR